MQVKVGQAFGFVPTFFKNLQKVVDICKKCSKIEKVVEAWLSLVERYIRDVEVASSNLVASIGQTGNVGNGIFGSFFQNSFKEMFPKRNKKKVDKRNKI